MSRAWRTALTLTLFFFFVLVSTVLMHTWSGYARLSSRYPSSLESQIRSSRR